MYASSLPRCCFAPASQPQYVESHIYLVVSSADHAPISTDEQMGITTVTKNKEPFPQMVSKALDGSKPQNSDFTHHFSLSS
jgi:hypothetical protein